MKAAASRRTPNRLAALHDHVECGSLLPLLAHEGSQPSRSHDGRRNVCRFLRPARRLPVEMGGLLSCGINLERAVNLVPRAAAHRRHGVCGHLTANPFRTSHAAFRWYVRVACVSFPVRRVNVAHLFRGEAFPLTNTLRSKDLSYISCIGGQSDCNRRNSRDAQDRIEQRAILRAQPRYFRLQRPRVSRRRNSPPYFNE
jgi:hypothetical protein